MLAKPAGDNRGFRLRYISDPPQKSRWFWQSKRRSFAKIKAILIVNTSTTAGDDLTVGGAAAQEWTAWVAAAGDKVRVPADSCLLISNKKTGWTVTDGASDTLRVTNTGANPITYKIAILGTSA